MENVYDNLSGIVGSAKNYDEIAQAISNVLDVIEADNYEVDISSIEDALFAESNKRHATLPLEMRYRKAFREISNYLEMLIIASVKEHILEAEAFWIPEGGKNDDDYVFNLGVIEKFEISSSDSWKHEDEDKAVFEVDLTGNLLKLFEEHECDKLRILAQFWADRYTDQIDIDDVSHVENMFKQVRIETSKRPAIDQVENLAEKLKMAPNMHLTAHLLKHSNK